MHRLKILPGDIETNVLSHGHWGPRQGMGENLELREQQTVASSSTPMFWPRSGTSVWTGIYSWPAAASAGSGCCVSRAQEVEGDQGEPEEPDGAAHTAFSTRAVGAKRGARRDHRPESQAGSAARSAAMREVLKAKAARAASGAARPWTPDSILCAEECQECCRSRHDPLTVESEQPVEEHARSTTTRPRTPRRARNLDRAGQDRERSRARGCR